jgi:hypothetical protein
MIDSFSGAAADTGRPPATCDQHGWPQTPILAQKPECSDPLRRPVRMALPSTAYRSDPVSPRVLPAATAIRIGDRSKPLAATTMDRIKQGLARYARPMMVPAGDTRRTSAARVDVPMPALTSLTYAGLLPEQARTQAKPSLAAVPDVDAQPDMLWCSPPIPSLWSRTATGSTGPSTEPGTVLDKPAPDGVALTGADLHWAVPIVVGGVSEPVVSAMRWAPNHR